MQVKMVVVVAVNNSDHADMIRNDIIHAVENRTTIFFVSGIDMKPEETVMN